MRIDEARRDHEAGDVDDGLRADGRRRDLHDAISANAHVALGIESRFRIHEAAPGEDEIEIVHLSLCRFVPDQEGPGDECDSYPSRQGYAVLGRFRFLPP
jgi:hypothetical protein